MKKIVSLFPLLLLCLGASAQQVTCNGVWGQLLVNQTFGQGNATDNWYGPLSTYAPGASTSTTFVGSAGPVGGILSDGFSGLAKQPSVSGQGNWVTTTDHTGNLNGLMFLINAPSTAATVFFEYTMDNLCPNTTLKLSVWILNANIPSLTSNPTYQYPNMTLKAVDAVTNAVLGTSESGDVAADQVWHQYSVIFNNGGSTSIKLQLSNNSVGSGYGNDLAIDDITVQPCVPESHILPKLDTVVCQNAVLQFNTNVIASPYNPAEYQWQYSADGGATWLDQGAPGSVTNYTFNTTGLLPGTYLLRFKTGPVGTTSNDNCVAISDTSIVEVSSFPHTVVSQSVCLGEVYNFYGRYIGIAGTYDTLVHNGPADLCGTLYTLNLTVRPLPAVDIAGSRQLDLCAGDTLTLKVPDPRPNTAYQWLKNGAPLPGETGSQYYVSQGGDYILAGQLDGCLDTSLRVRVTERPLPLASIISNTDGILCSYDTLSFSAETGGQNYVYQWEPAKAFRLISGDEGVTVKGLFDRNTPVVLTVFSPYGCKASDTAMAMVKPCCQVFVPNAFSPNNDALNDYFKPEPEPGQILLSLKIFDRYGKLVYDNTDLKKGWNGNYKNGEAAASDIYMYYLQYTCSDNKTYSKKGDITLIR